VTPVAPQVYGTVVELALFVIANAALLAGLSAYRLVADGKTTNAQSAIFYSYDLVDNRVVLSVPLALGFVATVARFGDYCFLRGFLSFSIQISSGTSF